MRRNDIACVLVTYNRLELLKQALESIKSQSFSQFDIIVVNNGSTDGTKEWLDNNSDLITLHQDNTGSAGGFYSGMKFSCEKGYEWMWLMDDDGVADVNQLENLLKGAQKFDLDYANALVCDVNDKSSLCFSLGYNNRVINKRAEAEKFELIPNSVNPWNGTLINKAVADKVGFVKKEMFIWGEEVEFFNRTRCAGFKIGTVTNALHYHPKARASLYKIIPFIDKGLVSVPPVNRQKIMFRNMGYNSKYYTISSNALTVLKYSIYFLLRFKMTDFVHFLVYYNQGRKNFYE